MKRIFLLLFIILTIFFVIGCQVKEPITAPNLSKCINLGNSLEAPKGQSWDVPMDISYFSIIKEAGFQTVRLPVRFSDYADKSNDNYLLDETFMQQMDAYIDEALKQDLTLILDLHHFTELMENPQGNKDCLIAIWKQLASRYKDYPNSLVFEPLNEPQQNLDSDTWNSLLKDLVRTIRSIDSKHFLIVGGANFNSIDSLTTLELPKDDRLIATIHYYEPNDVTFQGNPYHAGYENLSNVTWEGSSDEIAYLKSRLTTAKDWADANNVPLFLGEFGISNKAPLDTRISWTLAVASEANALGISYAYWEFASGFGIYDLETSTWNEEMLHAILNPVK